MADGGHGVVAAGHPLTAEAGARVLREGGNAVDAALAAMLVSFAAEPLLTGLGSGGYMLVAGGDQQPALLDLFVQAPSDPRASDGGGPVAELQAVDVSFGDGEPLLAAAPPGAAPGSAPKGG